MILITCWSERILCVCVCVCVCERQDKREPQWHTGLQRFCHCVSVLSDASLAGRNSHPARSKQRAPPVQAGSQGLGYREGTWGWRGWWGRREEARTVQNSSALSWHGREHALPSAGVNGSPLGSRGIKEPQWALHPTLFSKELYQVQVCVLFCKMLAVWLVKMEQARRANAMQKLFCLYFIRFIFSKLFFL